MISKQQLTLRLTDEDLKAMNDLTTVIGGDRGAAFVGPTAVIRFAMKAALQACQGQ